MNLKQAQKMLKKIQKSQNLKAVAYAQLLEFDLINMALRGQNKLSQTQIEALKRLKSLA